MPEPNTIGLDPEWIATVVAGDGPRPVATFAGFLGTGQMSRNARFTLDWSGTRRDGPASVVIKVPSAVEATRAVSFQHEIYLKECEFYRSLAAHVDVVTPGAHAVHFDPDAHDFAIVLDDLAGSRQGDQFTDPTDDQLALAIEQAAALHAPVWGRVDEPTFDALRDDPAERAAGIEMLVGACLPLVHQRLGAGLEPDVAELLEAFAGRVGDWIRGRDAPTTLVHGDFRPDNFMFGVTADAPPLAVVDWQTLSLGHGVTDIAYLLGGALDPERRRTHEADLLATYRDHLARRGVGLPVERCERDYALGSLHGIVIAISATAMADTTDRGDALFTLMLNRHGRHALDQNALARI